MVVGFFVMFWFLVVLLLGMFLFGFNFFFIPSRKTFPLVRELSEETTLFSFLLV